MRTRSALGVALLALALVVTSASVYAQQKTTIKTQVVTGTGSGRVFVGPVMISLVGTVIAHPIFRDPFTGDPYINEVNKEVTCDNLVAGVDVVIFNCTLHKNIKYKTLEDALTITPNGGFGPEGGIWSEGAIRHVTVWINFSGVADVPGALPGDSVQLEGFTTNQKLTATDCSNFIGSDATVLANAQCNTLEEKDDIVVTFKTTRIEQVSLVSDP